MTTRFVAVLLLLTLYPQPSFAVAKPEVFALIVTSNRSLDSSRPDLHYADDDGARFWQLLQMSAPTDNLVLLTEFDAASARLYPKLAKNQQQPTQKNVEQAAASLARRIAARRKEGKKTVFYFVFAGHGDVKGGKGYLELKDMRFGADRLEKVVLQQVKADRVHLILDSCNSFFMVSPRKPGGRRWATPKDLTRGFAARYPHVGVFLSTSAEGEVYEWSALQAGIFSHEVRSGLSGAADINMDRSISYSELASFVAVANKRVKNENYRPRVFARGPRDDRNAELFSLRNAKGRRLLLSKARARLWIRDQHGNRIVDLNKEAGAPLGLTLPDAGYAAYTVQVQRRANGRPVIEQYGLRAAPSAAAPTPASTPVPLSKTAAAEPLRLAALVREEVTLRARGNETIFRQIFAEPFGPRSHARMLVELGEHPTAVFGISRRDSVRMRHYLSELARTDRAQRQLVGWIGLFGGVMLGGSAIGLATLDKTQTDPNGPDPDTMTWAIGGAAAAFGALGLYNLFRLSEGEKALASFDAALNSPHATREAVVARTETHLMALAERDARQRRIAAVAAFIAAGLMVAGEIGLIAADVEGGDVPIGLHITVSAAAVGMLGMGLMVDRIKTPSERILNLYRNDPDLSFRVAVGPTRGGLGLSLSGSF